MGTEKADDSFDPFSSAEFTVVATESDKNLEEFDPFQIGAVPVKSKRTSPQRSIEGKAKASETAGTATTRASTALPPRLDVKFKLHEEVTSVADPSEENEGSSDISVDGTVLAQVTSSDALKNSPFIMVATSPLGSAIIFLANDEYVKTYPSTGQSAPVHVIKIPKANVGFIEAGHYQVNERVPHMPMLLERKITRSNAKVQIIIQVRSKLSNQDDLKEMSILLSISDKIAGDSVEINTGKGEWDRASRTVLWTLEKLPKGESFLVSVRAKLTEANAIVATPELEFPVMLRCTSVDQLSSAQFHAVEASGYPATVSFATVQRTFRIIHRLK